MNQLFSHRQQLIAFCDALRERHPELPPPRDVPDNVEFGLTLNSPDRDDIWDLDGSVTITFDRWVRGDDGAVVVVDRQPLRAEQKITVSHQEFTEIQVAAEELFDKRRADPYYAGSFEREWPPAVDDVAGFESLRGLLNEG